MSYWKNVRNRFGNNPETATTIDYSPAIVGIVGVIMGAWIVDHLGAEVAFDLGMRSLLLIALGWVIGSVITGKTGWITLVIYPAIAVIGAGLAVYDLWNPVIWPALIGFASRLLVRFRPKKPTRAENPGQHHADSGDDHT